MSSPSVPIDSIPDASDPKKRVLIADDHPMFRYGVASLISSTEEFEVVAEASTPEETLAKARTVPLDILLLDLSFSGGNGLDLTKRILAERPQVRIILLSMHDEQLHALEALNSGAHGYVMKRENPNMLLDALRKVADGSIFVSPKVSDGLVYRSARGDANARSPIDLLSERQLQVLELFGEGCSTEEVAARLKLSPKTIETHRMHIKEKLGFQSAPELVRFAINWQRAKRSTRSSAA